VPAPAVSPGLSATTVPAAAPAWRAGQATAIKTALAEWADRAALRSAAAAAAAVEKAGTSARMPGLPAFPVLGAPPGAGAGPVEILAHAAATACLAPEAPTAQTEFPHPIGEPAWEAAIPPQPAPAALQAVTETAVEAAEVVADRDASFATLDLATAEGAAEPEAAPVHPEAAGAAAADPSRFSLPAGA
jgi:hypothetical protein